MFKESTASLYNPSGSTVVYWMNRDQRSHDNWALIYAYEKAMTYKKDLVVVYVIDTNDQSSSLTRRSFEFIKQGLIEVESELQTLNIPFHVLIGKTSEVLADYYHRVDGVMLITDFIPLRNNMRIREALYAQLGVQVQVVDTHNIVPCWETSEKEEYAARTIRPKINKKLGVYLTDIPANVVYELNRYSIINDKIYKTNKEIGMPDTGSLFLCPQKKTGSGTSIAWQSIEACIYIDESVKAVDWIDAGQSAGLRMLKSFIEERLDKYSEKRNDPNVDAQSNLSPYFHFGHLSPQRVAYEVNRYITPSDNTADFLEEMIIRRELTDNYCFYNSNYDSLEGVKDWAKTTLHMHEIDIRDPEYTLEALESASTEDALWNAAQMEMVRYGKMHGYMRMYWAKKILEWSSLPSEAFDRAIYLNDKYSLDGNDPNGFVGVAWSVGGIHDRAWKERKIFGKIRYMNYNGCKRKFDVEKYIKTILEDFS